MIECFHVDRLQPVCFVCGSWWCHHLADVSTTRYRESDYQHIAAGAMGQTVIFLCNVGYRSCCRLYTIGCRSCQWRTHRTVRWMILRVLVPVLSFLNSRVQTVTCVPCSAAVNKNVRLSVWRCQSVLEKVVSDSVSMKCVLVKVSCCHIAAVCTCCVMSISAISS